MIGWSSSLWTTFYDDDDAQVILLFADNYAMLLVGRFLTGAVHAQWVFLLSFWRMFSSQVLCTMSAQFLTFFRLFWRRKCFFIFSTQISNISSSPIINFDLHWYELKRNWFCYPALRLKLMDLHWYLIFPRTKLETRMAVFNKFLNFHNTSVRSSCSKNNYHTEIRLEMALDSLLHSQHCFFGQHMIRNYLL